MAITSANQLELLQTAEAVAREKMIDPGLVVSAMEESLARAAKSRYGSEMDIRVSIDRKTGRATFTRVRTVVEDELLENYQAEMTVEQAKQYMENPQVGEQFIEEIPPVDMGRIAAQSAKQVILQKVREAERDRQYEEFKDRAGTIINGVVKREEYGNVIVDVGRGEAICAATRKSVVKAIARMTACAASSKKSVVKCVVHKFSFRVRRQNSWRNCLKWKCLKFTKASLKSNLSHAILVHAQKLRFTQTIIQSIPLALVSVCAAAVLGRCK